ncbi:thioredoxin domain-containing protein [Ferruginibacter albus]|uniref:thioredoxin domain-containing protein n=1 Tax=Ferruginibacter albus TaxID=2875540 RepID=UPI001CC55879|nr:thioredoxin domain-containing protein [Ferruginibacter albus]UAY51706.1 thioredoxin domain-containing protein [Ferruginibacter albus]
MSTNRLIHETSPYLLQHAHNPVDWYPWGEEALQKAKELNRPILVSIGYSACHWCHVMERESFEDQSTALIMNEHFINIKIDREERPDLDHVYMDAVQAMSGSGGWPLNVFLTPDAQPFYGGTYFPPVQAFNRSSWKEVLMAIATAWKERRDEIISQADNMVNYLRQSNSFGQAKNAAIVPEHNLMEHCHEIFQTIMDTADKEWGGFGRAPKFPQTFTIQFLLQYYHFTKEKTALDQALLSIDKMLQGGIYDHIAGGLARYSTDKEWLAPHFEKMLYDNALLINVLCDAYQLTRNDHYEKAIHKTIAFVQNELGNVTGGFYAALDADSEGEEGRYYVWQKKEIENILNDDAELFCNCFDVTEHGNWEEKNILRVLVPLEKFAKDNFLEPKDFEDKMSTCLQKLSVERDKRTRPGLDDKIILSWNLLMVKALCKAAAALNNDRYKDLAEETIAFIEANFPESSLKLFHTFKNDVAKNPAFLDDYAYLIDAYIHLYEITLKQDYLYIAKQYAEYTIQQFGDTNSPYFFFTANDQNDIIVRKKEIYDGATPAGNSVMASNLLKLSVIFDKSEWRTRADEMLDGLLPLLKKYPGSFGQWTIFLLQKVVGINEIAIIGEDYQKFNLEITKQYIPNKILMCSAKTDAQFPLLDKKTAKETLIYLCKNYACLEPVSTAQDLLNKLSKN